MARCYKCFKKTDSHETDIMGTKYNYICSECSREKKLSIKEAKERARVLSHQDYIEETCERIKDYRKALYSKREIIEIFTQTQNIYELDMVKRTIDYVFYSIDTNDYIRGSGRISKLKRWFLNKRNQYRNMKKLYNEYKEKLKK